MRRAADVRPGDLILATRERVCHVERVERVAGRETIHVLCDGAPIQLTPEEVLMYDASVWLKARVADRGG